MSEQGQGTGPTEPTMSKADQFVNSPMGCVTLLLTPVLVLALLANAHCSNRATEQAKEAAVEQAQSAAEAAEIKRKGFNCLSPIDGSEPDVVDRVKARLRDPDSFEHIETKITPDTGHGHRLIMTYRSRNGFGGMVEGRALAVVLNGTPCIANVQAIE